MAASAWRGAPDPAGAGLWGERVAAEWLARAGYAITGRRVRPGRRGEIDIVARKGGVLAFVEVKTRADETFGRPAAAVDAGKRRALCRAAASYLRRARYPDLAYRFDVVEVVGSPGTEAEPVVRHIADAFRFPARYRFSRRRSPAPPAGLWQRILSLFRHRGPAARPGRFGRGQA